MKILKINLGLFSLLAVFTISVFLTSCEQESMIDDNVAEETVMEYEPSKTFKLTVPDNMSEEDMVKWLDNLDNEEMKTIGETIDVNNLESRACGSWYGWRTYKYVAYCSGCGSPPAQHISYKYRYRWCSTGVEVEYTSTYTCKSYC